MNKKWLLGSAVLLLLVGSLLYWWPVLADTTHIENYTIPSTCPPSSKCIFNDNDNGALLIQTQNGDIDLKIATTTGSAGIYFNRRSTTTYGLVVKANGTLLHNGYPVVIADGGTYNINSINSITSDHSDESNISESLNYQYGEFLPRHVINQQIFAVSDDPSYFGFTEEPVIGLSSIYSYDSIQQPPLAGQLAFVRKGTGTTSTQQLQFRFNDSEFPLNWGPWREICDYSNNCHNFINVLDDSNTGDVVIYQDPDLLISSGLKIASTSSLLNCTVLSTVSGEIICGTSTPGGGDNLGDHTATQNIRLNKHWLSYDGDDEGVFVDQDGNVGIGTTSPATKLHLYDGSSGPIISLSGSDVNYRGLAIKNKDNQEKWFVGNNTSNNFVIRATGANDILTVSSTGNVGIGTSSPNVKLTVQGNIKASGLGGTGNRCLYADANGLISATTSNCGSAYSAGNGLSLSSTTFSLAASGTNNYITKWTGTNTLGASTIYDNGTSVGIGTSNPNSSVKLDVNGSIRANSLANPSGTSSRCLHADYNGIIQVTSFDCIEGYYAGNGLSLSGTGFSLAASGTSNYITKWTSTNTLGASIIYDDGTKVGIGTTSPAASLAVNGNAIANTPTADGHLATKAYVDSASQSLWVKNGSNLYTSSTSWNVGIGTTSPGAKLDVNGSLAVRGAVSFTSSLYVGGNVGIGSTTSPADKLQVFGNTFLGRISGYPFKSL